MAKKTAAEQAAEAEAVVQAEEAKMEEAAESTETMAAPETADQEEEELSPTARTYQRYFQKGFWNKKMLKNMVKKGKITTKEYEIITGEAYAG